MDDNNSIKHDTKYSNTSYLTQHNHMLYHIHQRLAQFRITNHNNHSEILGGQRKKLTFRC
jgi:hypothetical protein